MAAKDVRIERFTPRQVERALERLGDAKLVELETRLKGKRRGVFAKQLLANVHDKLPKPEHLRFQRLREVISAQVMVVQREIQGDKRGRAETFDLVKVSRRFGSFAARLLQELDAARAADLHAMKPGALQTIAADAARGEALASFPSYYPHARRLPTLAKGKTLQTLTNAQVRWLHRQYWSARPEVGMAELLAAAKKAKPFAERKEPIEEWHVQRLFPELRHSFPWPWRIRVIACASWHVAAACVAAREGTSAARILASLAKKYPGFPYHKTVKGWRDTEWKEHPGRYPFLAVLGAKGRAPAIEGRRAALPFERDGKGRLLLTEATARAVADLGERKEVLYGWDLDNFCAYVAKQCGGRFSRNTYEALLNAQVNVLAPWVKLKRLAMRRLALEVIELHEKRGIASAIEMERVLVEERGYKRLARGLFDYLRDSFPEHPLPYFHGAKRQARAEEARRLLDRVKQRPGAPYAESGTTLGFDAGRTKYLMEIARTRWPAEFRR